MPASSERGEDERALASFGRGLRGLAPDQRLPDGVRDSRRARAGCAPRVRSPASRCATRPGPARRGRRGWPPCSSASRSAEPSAPRASSSVDLSAGTTSASTRLIRRRAHRAASRRGSRAPSCMSSPIASSGTFSSLSMMRPSFSSSSGSVLTTVGSSGVGAVQSMRALAALRESSRAPRNRWPVTRLPVASCARKPRCSTSFCMSAWRSSAA